MEYNREKELKGRRTILFLILCSTLILFVLFSNLSQNNGPRTGVDSEYIHDLLSYYDHCNISSTPNHSLDLINGIESYIYQITYYGNTYVVTADLNLQFDWDYEDKCWRNTFEQTENTYLTFKHPDSINGGYTSYSSGAHPTQIKYLSDTHIELSFTQSRGLFGTYGVTLNIYGGRNPYYTSSANTINPSLSFDIDIADPFRLDFVVAPGITATHFYLY